MADRKMIYLDDAIDAVAEGLKRTFVEYRDVAEKLLNNVPSVQPEPPEDICGECDAWNKYKSEIKALPSAQPEQIAQDIATIIENEKDMRVILKNAAHTETHEWILCSERMPEEHEWMGTKRFGTTISDEVYVTFENPKGERFCKHLSFQNGKLSSFDQSTIDAFYKGSKPIAWMPLPKPCAERKEDASSR